MNKNITIEELTVTLVRDRKTGRLLAEIWRDAAGEFHRDDNDKPAVRRFDAETGIEHTTLWARHGKHHREGDKPAYISRHGTTGKLRYKSWSVNGRFWREDPKKPVLINYNEKTGAVKLREYRQGRKLVTRCPV